MEVVGAEGFFTMEKTVAKIGEHIFYGKFLYLLGYNLSSIYESGWNKKKRIQLNQNFIGKF